jgi:hypothetical protein
MKHVVEEMASKYPHEFSVAHTSSSEAWRFNEIVAWELYSKYDKRWGMNYKRDGSELSMDIAAFRVGPSDRHVECYDIIAGAGGPSPTPAWQDMTNYATMGQPGTARWAEPQPDWAGSSSGGGGGNGGGSSDRYQEGYDAGYAAGLAADRPAVHIGNDESVAVTDAFWWQVQQQEGQDFWMPTIGQIHDIFGTEMQASYGNIPLSEYNTGQRVVAWNGQYGKSYTNPFPKP